MIYMYKLHVNECLNKFMRTEFKCLADKTVPVVILKVF